MKNMKLASFVLILVLVSISCSLFTPTSSKDGLDTGDIKLEFDELPTFDPEAPLPSPGAAALRALIELDPSVAILESDVEAADRAAMNALLADLQAQLSAGSIEVLKLASHSGTAKLAIPSLEFSVPTDYNLVGDFDGGTSTSNGAAIITAVVSGWNDQMTPNVQTGAGMSGSATETEGGATNVSSIELGRNADGSTKFGFGSKTEVTKNGVSAKTEVAASLDGKRCPNADGQVSFTVKVRIGAESGGAGQTQDLTAFVRVEVNDDANIVSTTIDVTQSTHQVKDGRKIEVESGVTIKEDGNNNFTSSNAWSKQKSQDVTQADVSKLTQSGEENAIIMAYTALSMAKENWLNGGCTKIEAASPGTVEPGSTTVIPVKVRHRFEGVEVPSKLKAVLSGEKSIDPTTLPKTPGTLTYTAPDESSKTATITLTATSRRGKATLKLTANTDEASYKVSGTSGPVTFDGVVCIGKPFKLAETFETGSGTVSFAPSSRLSGIVSDTSNSGGCAQSGTGNYVITFDEKGAGTLKWTITMNASCPPYTVTKPFSFELPLQPATDVSCSN
jgi:hypothetical protein